MAILKLGYEPKKKKWKHLGSEYKEEYYNGFLVVPIHDLLWEKIKDIIKIRKKGWDALIIIDGMRRSGKSTLQFAIAYLLDPTITIDNFIRGMEDSIGAIEKVKDGSVLGFDEAVLSLSSKDAMVREQKKLLKIIDIVGQKKITFIFCIPSFFNLNREIGVNHSLFLLHVYPDKDLNRGRFAYFSTKRKKALYILGKKNFGSYAKPKANWIGRFEDFKLPFNDEYLKLKMDSLREALGRDKQKPLNESSYKTKLICEFKENCPDVTDKVISKGFGMSKSEYYRRKQGYRAIHSP